VYGTDATSSDLVREIALPDVVDVRADYAAVQVSDRAVAAAFVEWLAGSDAAAVFEASGFEVSQRE
jgi:ABC-type molybdate transport system substrate-binding protein